jgi:hypothetical protein
LNDETLASCIQCKHPANGGNESTKREREREREREDPIKVQARKAKPKMGHKEQHPAKGGNESMYMISLFLSSFFLLVQTN